MEKADWLLIFLADAPPPLDPVRVQKGMFLLAMDRAMPAPERYAFEPYLYGPMSRELYRDVRRLRHDRLVEALPVPSARWERLRVTAAGRERAAALRRAAGAERCEALVAVARVRAEVASVSFSELLARVYDRYPAYTTRSVFRRP